MTAAPRPPSIHPADHNQRKTHGTRSAIEGPPAGVRVFRSRRRVFPDDIQRRRPEGSPDEQLFVRLGASHRARPGFAQRPAAGVIGYR